MKMQNLNTFNSLYVKSMNKLHKVTHLISDKNCKTGEMFDKKQLVVVSQMPGYPEYNLMADVAGGDSNIQLTTPDEVLEGMPTTGLYIYSMGKYFQVAFVSRDPESGDRRVRDLPQQNVGLIDSTDYPLQKAGLEFHFWAFDTPANQTTKKTQ
ncbi:hypothetical protein IB292_02825 [Vibrio parahaemolyticus]|jgi:hypothetical protein|uniref:Uncharacterized protein n=2 Tax=Vibrio harveyi group TaxID=717610 RepID=A0A9Q3U7X0_VIBPH|nr:hypothetical protein [Vibrio parahaemolyticus]MCC3803964.1 hypothetical protein [Vibrio parahaemolyticus]CAH1598266.1 hypothetical protein THF1C08_50051 [Vibrio jasicida]CAH1601884.1 hypothetical protein THF1A12_50298 [Vibrio jasicida]